MLPLSVASSILSRPYRPDLLLVLGSQTDGETELDTDSLGPMVWE